MRKHLLSGVVLITLLSAACGGAKMSPTSPSAVSPSGSTTTGAIVEGAVRLGATAGVGSAADPMKVRVVGTDIVVNVSLTGQFALSGVPSGNIQLHFFGAGVDAVVTVGLVSTGETVTISVTVVGTSAVIEYQVRRNSGQSEEQIEGRVESLPPTQPAGTLVVAGRTVNTTATTTFRQSSATRTFADLEVGQRVHVKGTTSAGVFTATLIDIQNVKTDQPVNVNGLVSGLSGSELLFQFMVDGRLVTGDHLTVYQGSNGTGSFLDLANGVRVEVKGQQRDASVYAVRIHVNGEPSDALKFEAKGTISGVSGACPSLTFTLAGTIVKTDGSTQFKGGDCSAIVSGVQAEVKGVKQADGSVKATRVETEEEEEEEEEEDDDDDDDDGSGEFSGSGSIAGLSGTCPAISFNLKGVAIDTNASTKFEDTSCSALKNGDKVEVKGTKQSSGRVLARKIEK